MPHSWETPNKSTTDSVHGAARTVEDSSTKRWGGRGRKYPSWRCKTKPPRWKGTKLVQIWFSNLENRSLKIRPPSYQERLDCVLFIYPLCPSLLCFCLCPWVSNPPGINRIVLCPTQTFKANIALCFRGLLPPPNADTVSTIQRQSGGRSGGRFYRKFFSFLQPRQGTFKVISLEMKTDALVV